MTKVTLLWNYKKICEVVDKQSCLRSAIIKRAKGECSSVGASFETLSFTKFCRKTNRYQSMDLDDVTDGDKINIASESSSQSISETAPTCPMEVTENEQDDSLKAKLKIKLRSDEKIKLSEEERKFLFDHLELHENCSVSADKKNNSSCPNCEEGTSRRRKTPKAEINKTENDEPKEKKNSVSSEINNTPRPLIEVLKDYEAVTYDYELIRTYLTDNYTLSPNERDQGIFESCFKNLFPNRRAFVMGSNPTVAIMKKLHPYLFNKEQVFAEFQLLAEQDNMYDKYVDRVKKYCSSVIELSEPCPSKKMICNKIKKTEDEEQKEWLQMAGSLVLLPKYMGEDRRSMLICDNEESIQATTFPYVRCYKDINDCLTMKCHFEIFIEDIKLCRVQNIFEAFFGLMAAYYIFNAVYPEKCTQTLVLFEKLYTEYFESPQTKIPQKAKDRITYLKKYVDKKK